MTLPRDAAPHLNPRDFLSTHYASSTTEPTTTVSRRDILKLTGFSLFAGITTLLLGRRKTAYADTESESLILPFDSMEKIVETRGNIPQNLESLLQYKSALIQVLQFYQRHSWAVPKAQIGWIDTSRVVASHPAIETSICHDKSCSFESSPSGQAGVRETSTSSHANMALQFCTQLGTGPAGLCQPQTSEIYFTNLYEQQENPSVASLLRAAAAIDFLTEQGATVIGMIPTWRASNLVNGEEAKVRFIEALKRAEQAEVLIVIPAGNADTDLATTTNPRFLHELAITQHVSNLIVVGGINDSQKRSNWIKDNTGTIAGSNYGSKLVSESGEQNEYRAYYNSFVSLAEHRLVPSMGQNGTTVQNGTTFCVGDMVAGIGLVQAILRSASGGHLADREIVKRLFSETAIQSEDIISQHGIPHLADALAVAINIAEHS